MLIMSISDSHFGVKPYPPSLLACLLYDWIEIPSETSPYIHEQRTYHVAHLISDILKPMSTAY